MTSVDEDAVDRVAAALYMEAARQARDELEGVEINCDEIDAVLEEALDQSDRGAAILIFSFVETIMHRVFALHLSEDIKGGLSSIFENNGPLSTASSRIRMLHALSWIDKETAAGLDILRLIRNHFAHEVSARSFDNRRISGWIASLPPLEKRMETIPGLEGVFSREKGLTNRHLYLARATMLLWNLVTEGYTMPFARKFRVHHGAVAGAYDDGPQNLRNASRRLSRITLMIISSFAPAIFERAEELLAQKSQEQRG